MRLLTFLLAAVPLAAQFDPEGAQVISYFPHVAIGGARDQQWKTTLTCINPHPESKLNAFVCFYADDGSPMSFENGANSIYEFSIPPQGTVTLTSAPAPVTRTGWAIVASTLPIQ